MASRKKATPDTGVSCDACGAQCCRYTATQIDTPTSKREYDFIRWYLLHRHVNVFIDHSNGWYIEFSTPCEMLSADNRCSIYETRPRICRGHGVGDTDCEYHGATEPYKVRFSTAAEYESWLDQRGTDWRFKTRKT